MIKLFKVSSSVLRQKKFFENDKTFNTFPYTFAINVREFHQGFWWVFKVLSYFLKSYHFEWLILVRFAKTQHPKPHSKRDYLNVKTRHKLILELSKG